MFNNRLIPLATLMLLVGAAVCFLRPIKNQFIAKAASTDKYAVPEITCYPISQYKSPVKLKKFSYQGQTYFEVEAPQRDATGIFVLNFQVSPGYCQRIGNNGIQSREDFMPKPAAEYFADLNTDEMFKACELKKKQNCKQYIEELVNVPGTLNGENTEFLFAENADSLNRRGIKTDKALIVKPKTGFHLSGPDEEIPPKGPALITLLKKCVKVTPPEKVKNISVVRTEGINVPTRGKKSYFHVDVELVSGNSSRHESQIILANKEYCKRFQ